jgi:hypothetical protein
MRLHSRQLSNQSRSGPTSGPDRLIENDPGIIAIGKVRVCLEFSAPEMDPQSQIELTVVYNFDRRFWQNEPNSLISERGRLRAQQQMPLLLPPWSALAGNGYEPPARSDLEHFQEKWRPVFRRKCDQLKKLERVSDSSKSKRTLDRLGPRHWPAQSRFPLCDARDDMVIAFSCTPLG